MKWPVGFMSSIFRVSGSHYRMGYRHGRQAESLRPHILRAITAGFDRLAADRPDQAFEQLAQETRHLWQTVDPALVEMIRGLADGLRLEFERLLRYNLVAFLRDALTTRQGCTTWAATGPATIDGVTILAKNRDYREEHLPLQIVIQAEPEMGYRYTYVTSAGSPGVFVAGFNEAGLAVVDTHVSSTDVGPGLPAYALSMHILEEHRTVRSALAYLQAAPRLGRNNLLLADSGGDIALFEMGHHHCGLIEAERGLLVNTNHFISPVMRPFFVDTEPESLRGNSVARCQYLTRALSEAHGRIDIPLAQRLLASHADGLASICRHATPAADSSTIAAMLFLPDQGRMLFCHGQPCRGTYAVIEG